MLNDRQKLSEDGIIIVGLVVDSDSNIITAPEIVSRGFVYVKDSEDMMIEAKNVVNKTIERIEKKHITDWSKMKNEIRTDLFDYVWRKTARKPMILPMIMEV